MRYVVEGGQLFYVEHRTGGSTEEERRQRERVFMEYTIHLHVLLDYSSPICT